MRLTVLAISLSLFPLVAQAACLDYGYSVVFINGVFDTKEMADDDKLELQQKLGNDFSSETIKYFTGYNQTHLAGLGDLVETALPAFDQYDLDTILMQMHQDITTRKILLVGHSQGAVYANKIYEYLTAHGVPKQDVAVYAVASPDSYVAGGGKYINYELDATINVLARTFNTITPLLPNATFLEWFNGDSGNVVQGHGFIDMYLGGFGARMVNEMHQEMSGLKADATVAQEGCFDPPSATLAYQLEGAALSVADPTATAIKTASVGVYQGSVLVGSAIAAGVDLALGGVGVLGGMLGFGPQQPTATSTSGISGSNLAGFALIKAVAGSSLNIQDVVDLNAKSQGGAVTSAFKQPGEVLGEATNVSQNTSPGSSTPVLPSPGTGISPGFGGGAPPASATIVGSPEATTSTTSSPFDPPTPPQPLAIESLMLNGHVLSETYASPSDAPVATTTSNVVVRFSNNLTVPPIITKTANLADLDVSVVQTVTDCADTDAKTFCVTLVPDPGLEGQYQYFLVSGASDTFGQTMSGTSTYKFVVDDHGPVITQKLRYTNQSLPTVTGFSDEVLWPIQVLLNNVYYDVFVPQSSDGWAFTLQPGAELAEGDYPVVASSTDAYGNVGPVAQWTLTVDQTPPEIAFTDEGLDEGEATPATLNEFTFSVADATPTSAYCQKDNDGAFPCSSPIFVNSDPGDHTFIVSVLDAAGNQSVISRNYTVLP